MDLFPAKGFGSGHEKGSGVINRETGVGSFISFGEIFWIRLILSIGLKPHTNSVMESRKIKIPRIILVLRMIFPLIDDPSIIEHVYYTHWLLD